MKKNAPLSLKKKVYNQILDDILKNSYGSDAVLNEKTLIEKYGVSRSPIRDALTELCNEGVLRCIPRYGYEVVRLTEIDIQNIMEYRVIIEGYCLRKAIGIMSDHDIDDLEQYTMEHCCEKEKVDIWTHWHNNCKFHLRLNSYAKNHYVYDQLRQSLNTLRRAYANFHWERWHKTDFLMNVNCHLKIIDGIRQRDTDNVLQMLQEDINCFESELFF